MLHSQTILVKPSLTTKKQMRKAKCLCTAAAVNFGGFDAPSANASRKSQTKKDFSEA
jgi:hypothetical protein